MADPKHDQHKDQTAAGSHAQTQGQPPPQPPQQPHQGPTREQAQQLAAAGGSLAGIASLDETIRSQLQLAGPPGSGIFMLLDNLAVQTLGCTRTAFPTPASNPPGNYNRGDAPSPGVPGASPPGPLPGAGRGQAPSAASSAPLGPNA